MFTFKYMMSYTESPSADNSYNTLDYFLWNKHVEDEVLLKSIDDICVDWKQAEIGGSGESIIDKKIRNHMVSVIEYGTDTAPIFNMIHKGVEAVNYWHYNYRLWTMEDIQVSRYESKHFYSMHSDRTYLKDKSERKLTAIIGLTDGDNYTGGDVVISPHGSKKYETLFKLNRGDMIVFPCWVPYEIKPVKEGCMQHLTTWVYGPKFY